MDFQSIATILFIVIVSVILWVQRKKLMVQKILFPFLYLVAYRSKFGLKFMDKISKKHPKLVNIISTIGIYLGFAGMLLISYELIKNIIKIITMPEAMPGVGLVLPIPMKGAFYVPFFYWIISIFVLATVHEFAHGIVARLHKIKVKSSGVGFLSILVPIIPLAFVEPDEKQLQKKSRKKQLAVFAAGPIANVLFAFLIMGLSFLIVTPISNSMIDYNGVLVTGLISENNITMPAEIAGITENELIQEIDGIPITKTTDFTAILSNKSPGDQINLKTNLSNYDVILTESPQDPEKAYLGVYVAQSKEIKESFKEKYGNIIPSIIIWIIGLLYWLYLLNMGIGLFNLVPIGPVDGGRMLHLGLTKLFKEKWGVRIWKLISWLFILAVLFNIIYAFIK